MAIRLGDGNQGFTAPYRAANQPTGGRWKKNGGSDAPTLGSLVRNGRLATTRRPFRFLEFQPSLSLSNFSLPFSTVYPIDCATG